MRLERADVGRCANEGILSVTALELGLDGTPRPFPAETFRLTIDGETQSAPPLRARTFAQSATPLQLSLVVQANLPVRADIQALAGAARGFLNKLPQRAVVTVLAYGDGLKPLATRRNPAGAAQSLDGLLASERPDSPALEAFRAGLLALGDPTTQERRLLVLLSDGLSDGTDRDAFRAFGDLARAKGVPIDPIAYSASDERGPLLNLGEIAKRSGGSFRWAKTAGDLAREFDNLAAEVNAELELEFTVPSRCAKAHTIRVSHGTLHSNSRSTPAIQPRDVKKWWLAGGAGGLVVLAAAGFWLARRRR